MTRNARGDWRDAPVDAKIKPLVDALNATGVVETYASCQGHARRRSDPYVAFRCGVDIAARLDKTLHGLRLGGGGASRLCGHGESQQNRHRESQRAERPVARRIADAALQPLSLICKTHDLI